MRKIKMVIIWRAPEGQTKSIPPYQYTHVYREYPTHLVCYGSIKNQTYENAKTKIE